jgi:hypothetical protein
MRMIFPGVLPSAPGMGVARSRGEVPMKAKDQLVQEQKHVPTVTAETQRRDTVVGPVATRDRELIRSWAARHQAEPATGEATSSGPATVDVHDGGAGIRFNFPGFGRFRPITWDEWFRNFERHGLTFVYEESSDNAGVPSPRYRIVKTEDWKDLIG